MQERYEKDIRFLIGASALSLMVMALMFTFVPFVAKAPSQDAVEDVARSVEVIAPSNVPALLAGKGKPVMVVVYASTDPYCRRTMPGVMSLMKNHQIEGFTPLFLSQDRDIMALGKYLVSNDYQPYILPYIVRATKDDPLLNMLDGSGFDGHIPYIGFFDARGKMVAEFNGMVDKQDLLETINHLKSDDM